jgi:hypothetical protein
MIHNNRRPFYIFSCGNALFYAPESGSNFFNMLDQDPFLFCGRIIPCIVPSFSHAWVFWGEGISHVMKHRLMVM